ncbi:MAG: hypothetical protein ABI474_11400 [Actinomycetota bacterium]
MMSPTRGWLRSLRAALLGGVGFALALVAHLTAGGAAPGPVALFYLAGLVGLAAVLLTRTRLGPVRIGVSLAATQVVLHEVFMWLGTPAACAMTEMSPSPGGAMGRSGGPVALVECATGMAPLEMGASSAFSATAMVGAHVAATAVMAILLAYGEKVLWFLAGFMRPLRGLDLRLPELPALRVEFSCAPRIFAMRLACGGLGRRGPPTRNLLAIH